MKRISRPWRGVRTLMMYEMYIFERLRVVHRSVHPIEVRVMNEKHQSPRENKIWPSVVRDIIIHMSVLWKVEEHHKRHSSEYGHGYHRVEYVSGIVTPMWQLLLNFSKPHWFLDNIIEEYESTGGEYEVVL